MKDMKQLDSMIKDKEMSKHEFLQTEVLPAKKPKSIHSHQLHKTTTQWVDVKDGGKSEHAYGTATIDKTAKQKLQDFFSTNSHSVFNQKKGNSEQEEMEKHRAYNKK